MLRQFVAQKPGEAFPRYGLAMELKRRGQVAEAILEFHELIAARPEYVPAYLMAGNTIAESGDRDGAMAVLTRGIEAARAAGDAHARGELESALAALES